MALYVGYEGARSCTTGPQPGARALLSWVLGAYGPLGATNLGIYNCRTVRGVSTTSLHGEGRAVDIGFPIGDPDGNILAEALRLHSAELGIQCIIYERKIWSGSYPNAGWRPYNGVASHNDHLHVELSWHAARTLTAERIQEVLGGAKVPANSGPAPVSEDVRWQQDRLRYWGFDPGKSDGIRGPKTLAAIRAFQAAKGLKVDGIVGKLTRGKLAENRPPAVAQRKPDLLPELRRGRKSGGWITLAEKVLKEQGYYKGVLDEDFGAGLDRAVRAYQEDHPWCGKADGIIGKRTWASMVHDLKKGNRGPRVELFQNFCGWRGRDCDGIFGDNTETRAKEIQAWGKAHVNGSYSIDGEVAAQTREILARA